MYQSDFAMRKLEASNRIEAVRNATELGLIGDAPRPASGLAYNRTGEPARSSDLKVTPLKIDQLRAIRRALKKLVASCHRGGTPSCPIIESLSAPVRPRRRSKGVTRG